MVTDGQEYELGGATAGRDPRVNALVLGTTLETIPFAFKRIGSVRSLEGLLGPRGAIANFESLRHDKPDVELAVRRLTQLAGPPEPPARLHGDLWNGNVVWDHAGVGHLIDPAAYAGHRETDLAMLALFGLPQLPRVMEAYQEVAPLAEGWQDRVALHQLFPLLVHACLFGGSYGSRAGEAARRYL